jgi:hypothetical protein
MKAAQRSSETPYIPLYLVLAPAANAVVDMGNGEAVMEKRRDVPVPQVQQAKQQESREVTQADLEDQEIGTGEEELGVLMEGSPQAISDAESVNASQPTSPKRPKKQKVERKSVAVPT